MSEKKATVLLWVLAVIWGFGFVGSQFVLDCGFNAFELTAGRFVVASFFLNLAFRKTILKLSKQELAAGSIMGLLLLVAFMFQMVGLNMTTPSICAFITATYVVLVPFLDLIIYKKQVGINEIFGAILCVIGIFIISVTDKLTISTGAIIVFICAVCYAFQVCYTGIATKKHDAMALSLVMMNFVAISSFVIAAALAAYNKKLPTLMPMAEGIFWLIFIGLFSTCVAFSLQVVAQKHVESTKASIIMSMESVFAIIFSVAIYKEAVSFRLILGSVLIFAAVIISQIKLVKLPKLDELDESNELSELDKSKILEKNTKESVHFEKQ